MQSLLAACRAGDDGAREQVVELSMPLVRSLARRFAGRGERFDDLVQVGAIGLLESIERFDPERGEDFFRFAVPTITGAIRHHLRDLASVVRIPRRDAARPPPLPADPRRVPPLSLSHGVGWGRQLDAALRLEGQFDATDARLYLAAGFRVLRPREQQIVLLHFFAGMSQDEIAQQFGLSQVQVSRLIRASLQRMRGALGVHRTSTVRQPLAPP